MRGTGGVINIKILARMIGSFMGLYALRGRLLLDRYISRMACDVLIMMEKIAVREWDVERRMTNPNPPVNSPSVVSS